MSPVPHGIGRLLIKTATTTDFVGYRLIFLLLCFGVTGGIKLKVLIMIYETFCKHEAHTDNYDHSHYYASCDPKTEK